MGFVEGARRFGRVIKGLSLRLASPLPLFDQVIFPTYLATRALIFSSEVEDFSEFPRFQTAGPCRAIVESRRAMNPDRLLRKV